MARELTGVQGYFGAIAEHAVAPFSVQVSQASGGLNEHEIAHQPGGEQPADQAV